MSVPVRRAGRTVGEDGRACTWSVATGRRGRRWRWTIAGPDGPVAHTVELDPDDRFVKLESAAPGSLLTLHLEPDGQLHGNRVHPDGIDHLALPPRTPLVVLAGRAAPAMALAVAMSAGRHPRGPADPPDPPDVSVPPAGPTISILEVLDDLRVREDRGRVRRVASHAVVELSGFSDGVELDADGLPAGAPTTTWPLEVG